MSNNPPLRFSHSHHLLSVRGCDAEPDVLAFEGDEALSKPFRYRIEFTSADHTISKEMMLMKAASLTLQAPVDQGYGIKIQQPVRVIQGVVTGFERLGTSKDETRYALTLEPRLALLDRSHQNAIYQDMSVPQIVEKILRERHNMRGQDFLFSLSKEYPRREQVMQYGENDLHFITRLLGEVGLWFRFTTDTRLNIDVVEFYDSQQGYEKGLTLPSVPPSGQHSQGVDSVWEMESHHNVVQKQVSTRDYNSCCLTVITGKPGSRACGCASHARMPVTPTVCTCRCWQAPKWRLVLRTVTRTDRTFLAYFTTRRTVTMSLSETTNVTSCALRRTTKSALMTSAGKSISRCRRSTAARAS